jgi:hypothetical protein
MDPLFVPSLADLKANLRLSGTSDLNTDFDALLEQAVRKVRVSLRSKLGQARITVLQSYTQDSSPVAPDELTEYLRELAELTEIDMVKLELTYLLPMLFMEGAAGAKEVYNEEGAFRKTDSFEMGSLRARLRQDIQANLRVLNGKIDLEDRHSGNVTVIE